MRVNRAARQLSAVTVVLLSSASLLLSACGDADESPAASDAAIKSPVTGAERSTTDSTQLAAAIVTPREPTIPFKSSNGKYVTTYELQVVNPTPLKITPTKLVVADPGGKTVASFGKQQLPEMLALSGAREGVKTLTDSQLATLYVTLEFDSEAAVPKYFENTLTVEAPEFPKGGVESASAKVDVDTDISVPVLGPPLAAGSRYIAADACCTSLRHRRALLPIDDHLWLAQRFAIDWEQLDASGRAVKQGTSPKENENYMIFGAQTIAAADGKVVSVVDGLPNQPPGALPESMTLPEADGNHAIIDIGDGLYMLYAHLQAGTLKVKPGDSVKQGDPIGLVGNSGNTTAPHLHFHVMDGPSALTSEGVPYVINSFSTDGRIRSTDDLDKYENTTTPIPVVASSSDGTNTAEYPADLTLVTFK